VVRLRSPNRPTAPGVFSRRDLWRLFSLVLAVAMVGFLIRELNRPQVAMRLDQAMAVADPVAAANNAPSLVAVPVDPAQFRKVLDLAGWDAARFKSIAKGATISDADREELAELLWRLRTFDGPQLFAWADAGPTFPAIAAAPSEHVGELTALQGRVTQVERRTLPDALATRLEMTDYFECQLTLDGGGKATLITSRVPKAWLKMSPLDEPANAAGVFVKLLATDRESPHGLFVGREVAWHPTTPNPPTVSLGKSILGELGVDVGLLDSVRQREPIAATEREPFYQLLDASGRIGANQLTRFATQDLDAVRAHWAAEEQRLAAQNAKADASDPARRQLAREVQSRAAKGRFSVAPLFNDAVNQVGELVTLDGTARRVTRIDVGQSPDGSQSDVARRFGIDHYYEIDLFTDDSQNNPVVFCVRELPLGMPEGNGLHEPVRIAGFFFKNWRFQSHRATLPAEPDAAPPAGLRQIAPLLVGRSPIMLQLPKTSAAESFAVVAAGLFVLLLGVVWVAGWWLAREDRRFVRSTLAKQFSVAEGESLNDLDFDLRSNVREND
jgi:hypothetical protein